MLFNIDSIREECIEEKRMKFRSNVGGYHCDILYEFDEGKFFTFADYIGIDPVKMGTIGLISIVKIISSKT